VLVERGWRRLVSFCRVMSELKNLVCSTCYRCAPSRMIFLTVGIVEINNCFVSHPGLQSIHLYVFFDYVG